MFAGLLVFTLAATAAVVLAFRTRRGGWAGILLGFVATVALWIVTSNIELGGQEELLGLSGGAVVAGIAAYGLPFLDRLIALITASVAAYLMLFVAPGGGHVPLGFLVSAPLMGFAGGALLALLASGYTLARQRLRSGL